MTYQTVDIGYGRDRAANDYARGVETTRNVAVIGLGVNFFVESILEGTVFGMV